MIFNKMVFLSTFDYKYSISQARKMQMNYCVMKKKTWDVKKMHNDLIPFSSRGKGPLLYTSITIYEGPEGYRARRNT